MTTSYRRRREGEESDQELKLIIIKFKSNGKLYVLIKKKLIYKVTYISLYHYP